MTDPATPPAAPPVEPAEADADVASRVERVETRLAEIDAAKIVAPGLTDDVTDLLAAVESLHNAVVVMAPYAQYREESQVNAVRDELANAENRVATVKERHGIVDGAE